MKIKKYNYILLVILLIAGNAFADIRITADNQDDFTLLKNRSPYPTCYREDQSSALLGKIKRAPIQIGRTVWKEVSIPNLEAELAKLNLKKKSLSKKPRANRLKIRAISLKIALLRNDIKIFKSADLKCRPTEVPTPTPTPIVPTPTATPDDMNGDALSLNPYNENITPSEVDYILNRVAFGGSTELRNIGLTQGLTPLVNALVDGVGGQVAIDQINNETKFWESQFYYIPDDQAQIPENRIWTTEAAQISEVIRMIRTRNPLSEWMLLNLAQHFSLSFNKVGFSYSRDRHYGIELHLNLLRDHSLGSFRDLAIGMLTDPAMNVWLNNKDNAVGSPNQNFARELLELFLLGTKDPVSQVPNYDQSSIIATTAFVSGYREGVQPDPLNGREVIAVNYDSDYHDPDPYPLFSGIPGAELNASLTPAGLVDHVLINHPNSARYLADRFGGLILYPGLPENLVAGLAQVLRDNNYQLKPFLKVVLKSKALFSPQAKNSCITSPLESMISLARKFFFNQTLPTQESDQFNAVKWGLYDLASNAGASGQAIFDPPSVFGWKGSCNINRAGGIASGEGWLPAQRLFNRSKGCLGIINMFMGFDGDLVSTLNINPSTDTLPILINRLSIELFATTFSPQQQTVFANFMTSRLNDSGTILPIDYNINDQWYRWRKIPRLVCLMYDMLETNIR